MDLDDIFQQVLTHKHEQIKDAEKELEQTTTDLAKHQRRLKQIQVWLFSALRVAFGECRARRSAG